MGKTGADPASGISLRDVRRPPDNPGEAPDVSGAPLRMRRSQWGWPATVLVFASMSVVVTASPCVAVGGPRVARIVVIAVSAVSEAQTEAKCRPDKKAPAEVPTAKAAPKIAAAKATVSKRAARNARSNTSRRKVATSDPGGGKAASNTAAGKSTSGEATSKASSSKAAASETAASETSTSTAFEGYDIGWN